MANSTMMFGPIGRQVAIPYPQSGMSVVNNLVAETTDLLSGERVIYRPPVTFKTYNMSWKGGTANLQPIVDMHSGVYGQGPFYVSDPMAAVQGTNLLPSKWASSYLLSFVCNGWGASAVNSQTVTPEGNQVVFTQQSGDAVEFPAPLSVPVIPGQPLYFKAWGSATNGAGIRVYRFSNSTKAWSLDFTLTPTTTNDAPTALVSPTDAANNTYAGIKLVPYLPTGSTLTLAHMDLATNDYTKLPNPFRMGMGVGPVRFTGNLSGTITSAIVDRSGLSVDIGEVNRDPSN